MLHGVNFETVMIYLKLMPIENVGQASRNLREISVAREMGYEILIFATTKRNQSAWGEEHGYDVYYVSTRKLGNAAWILPLNRILAFLEFITMIVRTKADIVSGNNYMLTLIAYIANLFTRRKAKIIYDSHEFELYQDPNRSRFSLWFIKCVEGFLLRHVDLSLMVGDKIADGVQEIYKLETRPTVVRNIPPYWHLQPKRSADIRKEFLKELGISQDGFLLMYHGSVVQGRGIEYIICALPLLPRTVGLVIVGNESTDNIIETLRELAMEKGVAKRVFFHSAVSMTWLGDYIGAADVEVIYRELSIVNNIYSLPNKFFESIQATVPMVCSNAVEIANLVMTYDIGIIINENNEVGIAKVVMELQNDKALYARIKRNMKAAKRELCWERESLKLRSAINMVV